MLNTYINNPQTLNISAVSGTLVKNYKDSFIINFNMKSPLADKVLCKNPKMSRGHCGNDEPVVVLQTMLCGEGYLLAEIMWKEDFDKLFTESEDEE